MSVTVREAVTDDLDAIRDVAEASWYAAYGGMFDPPTIAEALAEYYDPELLEVAIEHDEIAFYIAAVDGELVGFASAEQTWADEVELHTIYVHPDRWDEGVGSALLDRVIEWARQQGVDRIACGVLEGNTIGIGFFDAVGFEQGRKADTEIVGSIQTEYAFERQI
jgi:ribosomal protein S18 acetylase RimI-like enzyme